MENSAQGVNPESHSSPIRRSKTPKLSKKTVIQLIIAFVAIGIVVGAYKIGDNNGAKRQKAYDDKQKTTRTALGSERPLIMSNYWSIVGTVEDVSSKSIKVKNNKGLVQEASVSSNATITEKPSKKVDIGTVKKGDKVIVTGSKEDNGKFTASAVLIQ